MSRQKSFSNEQVRMTLSLAFMLLAAPAVIPSDGPYGFAFYTGWMLLGAGVVLPLWSRFKSFSKQ